MQEIMSYGLSIRQSSYNEKKSTPSIERSSTVSSSRHHRFQSQKEGRNQNIKPKQVNELYGVKQKRRNVFQNHEIPSRDLMGNKNDSDEEIPEDTCCNEETWDEPPQSQDIWHANAYRNNLLNNNGADEDSHISENNPFAKQRLLKSKYKNLHSS